MKSDGVKIILFLPPYHPFLYDHYIHSSEYKNSMDLEEFFRNIAKVYDLIIVGSYNPDRLSIPESAFSDGLHLRNDTELKKIFSHI
jgi:predicted amidohydrolase